MGFDGTICLVAWTGSQYNMIQRAQVFSSVDPLRESSIEQIRKDVFSTLPNQVFIHQRTVEAPYVQALYRMLIDPQQLRDSLKVRLPLDSKSEIVEWRQVSIE